MLDTSLAFLSAILEDLDISEIDYVISPPDMEKDELEEYISCCKKCLTKMYIFNKSAFLNECLKISNNSQYSYVIIYFREVIMIDEFLGLETAVEAIIRTKENYLQKIHKNTVDFLDNTEAKKELEIINTGDDFVEYISFYSTRELFPRVEYEISGFSVLDVINPLYDIMRQYDDF